MKRLALELACLACLLAAGVVLGFCAGGWLGPPLFGRGGQGLEELGFMFNGAILGGSAALIAAAVSPLALPAERRLRLALSALGLASLVAAGTWVAATLFEAW